MVMTESEKSLALMNLTLKRGFGRIFAGENWRLAGERKWTRTPRFVPTGNEPFQGTRLLDGAEHAVFRCSDDDFLAQLVSVCELPVPEDGLEVLSFEPDAAEPESTPSEPV